ncbi:NAD-dependent epimerase/dehydratase family protein [Microbacterium sp. P5_E9]
MPSSIVLTGAAGSVGTRLRPLLRAEGHELTLVDIASPPDPAPSERSVTASVTDVDALTAAFTGADAVVHLAGFAGEMPWADILRVNIDGGRGVLEAARRAGVRRVLLASSIHAVGFHTPASVEGTAVPPFRPDTYYGVGKVVLEALGQLYADRFGMSVVAARLGTVEPEPTSIRSLSTWLSIADLARLVAAVTRLEKPGFHTVWGLSANQRGFADLSAGAEIGYVPVDDAEAFAARLAPEAQAGRITELGAGWIHHPLGEPF